MNTPLVRELAIKAPQAEITLIVMAGLENLVRNDPSIKEVIGVDVNCRSWLRPIVLPVRHYFLGRKVLARRNFDLAIAPRSGVDSWYGTFLTYFSGAPIRVGYSEKCFPRKAVLNRHFDRLLTSAVPGCGVVHETGMNLNLLSALSVSATNQSPSLWIGDAEKKFAALTLAKLSNKPLVCISPTSGRSSLKQWGVERFRELAVEFERKGWAIVLVGTSQDRPLAAIISASLNGSCLDLTGKTTLAEMAGVIAHCDVYIGNDAGPSHVAAALGKPSVTLFGPTCEHRFAPSGLQCRTLKVEMDCSPCRNGHTLDRCRTCIYEEPECLRAITVAHVLEAVREMVQGDLI